VVGGVAECVGDLDVDAADRLAAWGVEASVWDVRVVKPLDPAMIADAARTPLSQASTPVAGDVPIRRSAILENRFAATGVR